MNEPSDPPPESRAVRLGTAFDLLAAYRPPLGAFFERRGSGVAGTGVPSIFGAAVPMGTGHGGSQVLSALRRVARSGPDVRPVAIGAYAFVPGGSRLPELVIPWRAVRREPGGLTWRLDLHVPGRDGDDPPPSEPVVAGHAREPFADIQLREVPAADAYEDAVGRAVDRIHRGELRKVVLARTIEVTAERAFDPRLLVHRLRAVDPDSYAFAVPTDDGVLVGASPELLVSRRGPEVRSNPLAGSGPRSGDAAEDRANAEALVASAKDREEHAIVVDAVAETLGPLCTELAWDPKPVLRETPNVWHLSTRFRGLLREPAPTSVDLVAALHPTPAVAGDPRDAALATIAELEPFDRGRYAGAVGWVDAEGDGEWAIALRCAELRGDRAVLYAGAGIVAGSEPARELEETDRKFRAFLDALRWG
jgi:isochorismate synthase